MAEARAPSGKQAAALQAPSAQRADLDFAAGALAGCCMRVALFPVDTIKTQMQTGGASLSEAVRAAGQRGIPKLYRGISPAMLEIGINRGALMGLSTHFKTLLPRELPEWASDGAAGVAAGATKTVCLHPLDTLTCRGQVGGAQWALLWPRPQLGALYNGFGPAIARSAGGMGIWLTVRNGMYRAAEAQQVKQGTLRDFLVGGAASTFTDLCTFPLDTLKKNLQANGGSAGAVVQSLVRDGGLLRLYRGYGPRFFIVAANGGLWNYVYVQSQKWLYGLSRERST